MIRNALFASALSLATLSLTAAGAQAASVDAVSANSRSITVAKDKSIAFRLDSTVGELVVAAPDIAEIVAKTDHSFYLRGKKAGATNVLVYGPAQQLLEVIDVRVGPDAEGLRQDLAANMPGEPIQVTNYADGVLLSGTVSTNSVATRAKQVALRYAPDAVSTNFSIRDPQQVVLEVRVIEAGRSTLRDAGIDVNVLGTNGSIVSGAGLLGVTPPAGNFKVSGILNGVTMDATLHALEDRGLIKLLAQPNLVALSGEEASFLAGGEFPLPVPQQQNIVTIEFKPFGVSLKFTPQVEDNGMIHLKVEPEVSALDKQNSVRINGFDVPSLTTRKASTTVELESGKSFAIAGLFQKNDTNSIRETPFLGDIPILGALFRSEQWNKQETELVIVVTPRLADVNAPIPDPTKDLAIAPAHAAAKEPAPAAASTFAISAPGPVPPETHLAPVSPPAPVAIAAPAPAAAPEPTPPEAATAQAPAPATVAVVQPTHSDNIDDLLRRLSLAEDAAAPGA